MEACSDNCICYTLTKEVVITDFSTVTKKKKRKKKRKREEPRTLLDPEEERRGMIHGKDVHFFFSSPMGKTYILHLNAADYLCRNKELVGWQRTSQLGGHWITIRGF